MVFLFLIYMIIVILIFFGYRRSATVLTLLNLAFCLAMFNYHVTDALKIAL